MSRGVHIPEVGAQVPRRGNALSFALARLLLRLTGWRFEGSFPDLPRFVLIVAPHTSNWDFPLGVVAMYALGLRGVFLGKHTVFRWPLGIVMRWLGGIPVDRSAAHNVVFQTTALFAQKEKLVLVVAPEGTRKKARWRTGFWHVAHSARVPIVPVAFDYSAKRYRLLPPVMPTDDIEADFVTLKSQFTAAMARNPAQY
jgi:1-acyl-sn-glycerol-3-phosphate acyltransferase